MAQDDVRMKEGGGVVAGFGSMSSEDPPGARKEQVRRRDEKRAAESQPTATNDRGRGDPNRLRERPKHEDRMRHLSRGAFDTFHEWDVDKYLQKIPFL